MNPEGSFEARRAGDLPFSAGAAVCAQDKNLGGGRAVAVFEGVSSGEMGAAHGSFVGAAGEGPVGEHRVALEAGVGARIPRLVRGAIGPRPLGVGVGGRCLSGLLGKSTRSCVRMVVIGVNERS